MIPIKKTCRFYLKTDYPFFSLFDDELVCFNEVWDDSDYCKIHTDFPDDEDSPIYNKLLNEKNKIIDEIIENRDDEWIGAILPEINIENKKFSNIKLPYFKIKKSISFVNAEIGDLNLYGAVIEGDIKFNKSKIENVYFDNAIIKGNLDLRDTDINEINFESLFGDKGIIEGEILFNGSEEELNNLFKDNMIIEKK